MTPQPRQLRSTPLTDVNREAWAAWISRCTWQGFLTMTSDGRTHTVQIPIGGQPGDPTSPALCCAKGCHTGGSRKRLPADN